MEASCQCGAVKFTTPLPKPLALYICHCLECRKQTSSAFGTSAIFPRFDLPQTEPLSCYTRPTGPGHTLYCYFCRQCGTRLLHTTPGRNIVSVKGGCLENLDWRTAIHIWTKSAMVPIPEDAESYPSDPAEMKYGSNQEILDQPGLLVGSGMQGDVMAGPCGIHAPGPALEITIAPNAAAKEEVVSKEFTGLSEKRDKFVSRPAKLPSFHDVL